jgi:predicted DsbA family dithiol-disulfide isomerase
VTTTWLPFYLHPEYPPEGLPRAELIARYGERMSELMQQRFEQEALVYNPHPDIVPNTRDALRVTELARDRGLHEPVHDRLMDAYWAEARNIGDRDELRSLVVEAGLDADEVDRVLADEEEYLPRVLASTQQAQQMGINGIPAFLLDSKLLVLGAQPREVFESAFEQLAT